MNINLIEKDKIIKFINKDVYEIVNQKNFELVEEEQDIKYTIRCTKPKKSEYIIIKTSVIKQMSMFILSPPKDCDYIIIDNEKRKIYYIELKNSNNTCTSKEISSQLQSGKKWIEHLSFILNCEDYSDNYKELFICVRVNARMDNSRRKLKNEYGFIAMNGNVLNFLEFTNIS